MCIPQLSRLASSTSSLRSRQRLSVLISTRGLTKSFPIGNGDSRQVLHGIDLTVSPGEFVSVVGPSGSGKSTLVHCISGLEPPTTGEVWLDQINLGEASATALARLRRSTIGFIFQSYNLVGSLTALQNVALQTRLAGKPRREAQLALESVGLGDRADAKPSTLSGGEQQRVAIARALAAQPKVLFADEPTGALDTQTGATVLALLRTLAEKGSAVVTVTHDLEAAATADRVLVLRDGRIHGEYINITAAELLEAMAHASVPSSSSALSDSSDGEQP